MVLIICSTTFDFQMSKLRVIQSNDNGFVSNVGDLCFSGQTSFTNRNPQEIRQTLFILKSEDRVQVSVFDSVYSGETDSDGMNKFVCISTPNVVDITDTELSNIHLMSSLEDKMNVVNYVLLDM